MKIFLISMLEKTTASDREWGADKQYKLYDI